jgi:polar amino acid transport system substrate-binding protein
MNRFHGHRRSLVMLAFAILLTFVSGCAPLGEKNSNSLSTDTLQRIRSTKQLNVGYFLFEPTIMEDPASGKLDGVFIDMIESIGRALDAKVVYHKVDLANFAAGLQSRQFDVCIGAVFATPQRATAVLFTRPIFYTGYTGVERKNATASFSSWQDLDKSGLRVATKQGSAIDDFVRDNFKHAEIVRLTGPDLTLPLAAVSAGQADVGLMNQVTVFTYLRAHPELKEILTASPVAPTYFAWSVRPDDLRWLLFLNTAIDYMEDTSDLYRYESKYGIPLQHQKKELVFSSESHPEYWKVRKPDAR